MELLLCIAYTVIPHYFSRWMNVANSIMTSGLSTSQMVMPLVITYLHEQYGYRGATLIIGAFALNSCAAALVLHPVEWHTQGANYTKPTTNTNRYDNTLTSSQSRYTSGGCLKRLFSMAVYNLRYIKSPKVLIIALQISIQYTMTFNVIAIIPFVMHEAGFSQRESSFCLAMCGLCNLASRLLTAFLACCPAFRVLYVYLFGYFIAAVSVVGKPCTV